MRFNIDLSSRTRRYPKSTREKEKEGISRLSRNTIHCVLIERDDRGHAEISSKELYVTPRVSIEDNDKELIQVPP